MELFKIGVNCKYSFDEVARSPTTGGVEIVGKFERQETVRETLLKKLYCGGSESGKLGNLPSGIIGILEWIPRICDRCKFYTYLSHQKWISGSQMNEITTLFS